MDLLQTWNYHKHRCPPHNYVGDLMRQPPRRRVCLLLKNRKCWEGGKGFQKKGSGIAATPVNSDSGKAPTLRDQLT